VDISTDAWKATIDNAERQVVLAERKLERLKVSCAPQVKKLQVFVFNTLFVLHSYLFIPSFAQVQNDTLQKNERDAYASFHHNNMLMRKV
jgi:hypothetical protein